MSVTDALEIEALLSRYCRAVDSKDWVSYRALFTDDARVDYAAAGLVVGTVDDAVDFLGRRQQSISVGTHYVTNIESSRHEETFSVIAMWFNVVALPGSTEISYFAGRWHDDLVRTPAGWRIRNLRLEVAA
ncbi:MAG: nuclear transport factor 2 family protein [Mycobacterium sp.]|nr:nuclear transport factor 2 family protein [Mycobacterium sp.]